MIARKNPQSRKQANHCGPRMSKDKSDRLAEDTIVDSYNEPVATLRFLWGGFVRAMRTLAGGREGVSGTLSLLETKRYIALPTGRGEPVGRNGNDSVPHGTW